MNFDATLKAHLDAIRRRDLDAYAPTVHPDVTLVLPNGAVLAGRDAVVDFHREWFADDDWRMDLTPERRVTVGPTETAVFLADYHDVDEGGAPVHMRNRLALVFLHDGDGWLLLHDQNTPVPIP